MERTEILANFNDKEGDIQFLVLSAAVSSAGLNLHGACHNGIITDIVWNAGTVFQGTGRLFRIGQKRPITWKLVHIAGTVNDWMEDRVVRKFVPEVMARMVQAPIADPELQRFLAFEAVRVMLSQSFNRYSWDVQRVTAETPQLTRARTDLPSRSVINFRSARSENIGHFYSRVVHLMMQLPTFRGGPLSDKDEKYQLRQVINKLRIIGPNWVDANKDVLEAPGFNFSRLTWNKIVDFAEDLDVDMDGPEETWSKTSGNQAARGAQTSKRRRVSGPADDD
ncbi:hypothetical protein B0T18DRAFT_427052 [Schizothecium vesticola]|uniref:Helicase C-terminal domain-containing protein n=1 Tax=Schizothecium vesticola TaxID=314040 RepID=A0AA40KBG9_9PEZI|nr:hypothetical protein B0T18DRAFT_427052 [Schizothecium vesticola]